MTSGLSSSGIYKVQALVLAVSLGSITGCGSVSADDLLAQANSNNIQRLTNLYGTYQRRNNLQGPTDEADFRAFINKHAKKLERIGVDPNAIDDLFVNERDSEPFAIRYGVPTSLMGSTAPVVFEATGVDGMRMVGFLDMTEREVDQAEYDRLWSGAADSGPAASAQR